MKHSVTVSDWEVVCDKPGQISIYYGRMGLLKLVGLKEKFLEFAKVWGEATMMPKEPVPTVWSFPEGKPSWKLKGLRQIVAEGTFKGVKAHEKRKIFPQTTSWLNAEKMAQNLGIPPGTLRSELVKEQKRQKVGGKAFSFAYKGWRLNAYRGGKTWWVRTVRRE